MNEQQQFEEVPAEKADLVPVDSLGVLLKTEIDSQIATARAFPRSLGQFLRKAESMATITQGVAESCVYALKRKEWNPRTGLEEEKTLQGPSVRLAEIIVASYGNIRAAARIIGNDGRFITAQGMCHDLESNTMVNMEVKRKITNKKGKTYSEDMQVVTGNAACAIAFRNVVFKVIPAALITDIYEKVQTVARGDEKTLPDRRKRAMKFFLDKGVTEEQILITLNIATLDDIDLDRLQILSGMKSSFVNQEFTLDELFPLPDQEAEEKKKQGDKLAEETLKMADEALVKAKGKGGKNG